MKKKHLISLTVILSCLIALIAAGGYYIHMMYYSQDAEDLAFLSGSYKTELHHLDLRHKLIDRRVPNLCRVLMGTHFIDNIWSIDLAENQLARISDLSCFGNLKELNLSYNAFPRVPDM